MTVKRVEADIMVDHLRSEFEASSESPVESGQPLVSFGIARLGHLSVACDGSIEGQVWGAGSALARHLLQRRLDDRPEVVVEVGSGTGIAGLSAAAVGACRVVLTDRAHVIPRLHEAIERNRGATEGAEVVAAALEWGDARAAACAAPGGADLILAADVLYSGDAAVHAALRRTLAALGAPRDATILHAYEERWPQIVRQ